MTKKKYKWIIPEEYPYKIVVKERREYDECIKEFLRSGFDSARVNMPHIKPKTLASQLYVHIKKLGLKDQIKVCLRGDRVYLMRTGDS